jgi:hypothetical protein
MWTLAAVVLLGLHLLAVNVASAGPLAAAWLAGRGEPARVNAQRMARWSLAALLAGGLLGAPLLLAPSHGLRSALARFPASTYWFAGTELLFSAVCVTLLINVLRSAHRPILTWGLALASATNLLYHFPPLMAVIGRLAGDARWASAATIDRRTLLGLAARPEIVALWVHFVLASIAAAAVVAMWPPRSDEAVVNDGVNGSEDKPLSNKRALRGLATIALTASALQAPVGAWLLVATSAQARDAIMGGDAATSACFVGALVAALALLQTLAAIAMGDQTFALRRRATWLLVIVAGLMAGTLSLSRAV